MNYPFATNTPYIHATMSQAVQVMMNGAPLPPNCLVMAVPYQQVRPMRPQIRMPPAMAANDQMMLAPKSPYYRPSPYRNPPQPTRAPLPPQNYNYPVVPFNNTTKPKGKHRQQLHPNLYNSSSFDSYMRNLSWSRLFDHRPSQKNSKRTSHEEAAVHSDKKTSSTKKQQSTSSLSSSSSSSSTSSTTSDETIRRVTVTSRPPSNLNSKQQTKGSLPFKYSSEFIPGLGKQQVKPNDVFIIKNT